MNTIFPVHVLAAISPPRLLAPRVPLFDRCRETQRARFTGRRLPLGLFWAAAWLGSVTASWAATYTVTSSADTDGAGTLRWAITQANANPGSTINITNNLGTITFLSQTPLIVAAMTINGGTGNTVSGNNADRIFFIDTPNAADAVTINNLTLANGYAKGGDGGRYGGGGGLGAGGAIFVNRGAVTVQNISFTGNAAQGGTGGNSGTQYDSGGGGGGGLGGNGGAGGYYAAGGGGGYGGNGGRGGFAWGRGGGGGLIGNGGEGSSANSTRPSGGGGGGLTDGGNANGEQGGVGGVGGGNGAYAYNSEPAQSGSLYGGGGGSDYISAGGNGGTYGGGGAAGNASLSGGNGGDFGGGGGNTGRDTGSSGPSSKAGDGGFGGGGGGGGPFYVSDAGNGGFGGGAGGGGRAETVGTPGILGGSGGYTGTGYVGGGGGGGAAGGAIFIRSENGATLTFVNGGVSGGNATSGAGGGSGAQSGTATGTGIFLHGGNATFQVNSGTSTISDTISDAAFAGGTAGSITKTGSGTLALSGNNTFAGGTTITNGSINFNASGNFGTGKITLNGGGLQWAVGNTIDISSKINPLGAGGGLFDTNGNNIMLATAISGSGGLTKQGAGTLTLRGGHTFSGALNVAAGTLTVNGGGSITNNATSFVGNSTGSTGTLIVTGANSRLNMGADLVVGFAGNGSLTISNGGCVQNTYTQVGGVGQGDILVTGAGSQWVNTSGLVLGNQGMATLTISSGGYVTSTDSHIGRSSTVLVTGTGSRWDASSLELGQSGTGQLTIAAGGAVNTGTVNVASAAGSVGAISLSGGTLAATKLTEGSGSGSIAFDGGVLQAKADESDFISSFEGGDVTLGAGGALIDSNSHAIGIQTQLSGLGALTKRGLGTLTLSAANTYTGGTVVDAGTLVIGNASALGTGSLTVNNGTLDLTGQAITVSELRGASISGVISNSAAGASIITSNQSSDTTYAGAIRNGAGTIALVKQGQGTLTLTGANTYTGTTTLSGGTLRLEETSQSSSFAIATGTILELHIASGARDFGSTVFSGTGALVKTGAGTVKWDSTSAVFQMDGGSLIDVREGSLIGGSFANEVWTNNKADLNVMTAAEFNGGEANVRVDALTGSGTIRSGSSGFGYENFTFGVDNGSGTFDGVLADNAPFSGNYVKAGTGTQILTGESTFSGSMTVAGGTLQIGNGGATGSLTGPIQISEGASLAFQRTGILTMAGSITDDPDQAGGAVTQLGTGTTILTGNNTYSGGTTISAGILTAGHNSAVGTGRVTITGGTLVINEGVLLSNTIILAGGSLSQKYAAETELSSLKPFIGDLVGGIATDAELLDGTTSSAATLTTAFTLSSSATNDIVRQSDVFSFSGVPEINVDGETDMFVLQLTIQNVTEESYLGWLDTETNTWVNALEGNFGTNSGIFVLGAYDAARDFQLGTYGVDIETGSVWAVLNHNSDFATIPEPGTWALILLAGASLFVLHRKTREQAR